MGCCLTKKSRDNRPGSGKESLLSDDRLNSQRGLSLTGDSAFDNRAFNHTASTSSYDTASIDLGAHESPRGGYDGNGAGSDMAARKVVGKSLLEIPDVTDLEKRTWAHKRGHMVSNRYILRSLNLNRGHIGSQLEEEIYCHIRRRNNIL